MPKKTEPIRNSFFCENKECRRAMHLECDAKRLSGSITWTCKSCRKINGGNIR